MRGLIYYVPGARNARDEVLVEAGLSGVVEGPFEQVGTKKGPDGKGGVLFRRAGMDGMIGYREGDQVWKKAPGGKYWVGYAKGEKPGPEDLIRARPRGGIAVTLADGNPWTFPVWRDLRGRWDYNDAGELVQVFPEEHRQLADDGAKIFEMISRFHAHLKLKSEKKESMAGELDVGISDKEVFEILVRYLNANYCIGEPEAVLLDVIRVDDMFEPMMAIMDNEALVKDLEARKKKRSPLVAPSGSAGEPG